MESNLQVVMDKLITDTQKEILLAAQSCLPDGSDAARGDFMITAAINVLCNMSINLVVDKVEEKKNMGIHVLECVREWYMSYLKELNHGQEVH